jgi:hypothetical protein
VINTHPGLTTFLALRAVALLRRLVRCEEARLELERLRYERDYPPVPTKPAEPRKTEISRPSIDQMNEEYRKRQTERMGR